MTVFSYLGRNFADYWEFYVTKAPFLYHFCNKSKKILPFKNLSTPLYRKDDEYIPLYVNLMHIMQQTLKRLSDMSFYQFIILPN
jgi:hypothetical protein